LGIPSQDIEFWIREQKKKGNHIIPMKGEIATIQRTITDQMNYTASIQSQIDQCRWALLYGTRPFALNVIMLMMMIPEQDKDDKFREDVKNSKQKTLVNRGKRTDTSWYSTRRDIMIETWVPDYFSIFEACINLFRRRGMLWSESKVGVI